jgi:hypothetical protein
MDIRFVSTLTPGDEDRFAPMVIDAVKAILDALPISYTLRVETTNARIFQHSKADSVRPTANGGEGRDSESRLRDVSVA